MRTLRVLFIMLILELWSAHGVKTATFNEVGLALKVCDLKSKKDTRVSFKEAKKLKLETYWSTSLCPNGHVGERFVETRSCVLCMNPVIVDTKEVRQAFMEQLLMFPRLTDIAAGAL